MRYIRFLASFMVLLLVSVPAIAVTHHEDFDEARANIDVLSHYVWDALDVLNRTLESCLVLDMEKAISWSNDYSDKVVAAKRTLDRIPREVGSYQYLERFVKGLARIEVNLTMTAGSMTGAVIASMTIRDHTTPVWTLVSMRENLTELDNAFLDLEKGLALIGPSSQALVDDITHFMGSGQNVSNQLALAGLLADLGMNITEDLSTPWDIMAKVLVQPMWNWALGTLSLMAETTPDKELERCSSILSSVLPLLTGGMKVPVGTVVPPLAEAAIGLRSFGENQSLFLASLDPLEARTGDLAEQISHFQRCYAALSSMDDSLLNMEGDRTSLSAYDNGSVHDGLTLLGGLLEDYRERMGDIDLFENRLQTTIGMVNTTYWSNVIVLDADGDGTLSAAEVSNLTLGIRPGELAEAMNIEWETLKAELLSLPEWMLSRVRGAIMLVEEHVKGSLQFTSAHHGLVHGLGLIMDGTRSDDVDRTVGQCLSHLSVMEAVMSDLPMLLGSLGSADLDAPGTYVPPLGQIVSLYKEFLLGYVSDLNETFISVTVWPDVVPYDLTAHYSIVVLDKDVNDGMILADGLTVTVGLDGEDIAAVTVSEGMARGELVVRREMALGEHLVSVKCLDSTGTELSATDVLTVRRLGVIMTLTASRTVLREGDIAGVRVKAMDELLRPYQGSVLMDGVTYPVDGNAHVQFRLEGLGEHIIIGTIPRTDHFEGAIASIEFLAVMEPVISLEANRSWLYLDETLSVKISVISGKGIVSIFRDDVPQELGPMGNGTWRMLEVHAKDLGPGRHVLQARLATTVGWALSGWSDPVEVEVLAREPEEEPPEPPNGAVPWREDGPPTFWERLVPDWEWLRSPVLKAVLIALVSLTIIIVGALLVIRLRKGGKIDGRTGLPSVHVKRRTKVAPSNGPLGLKAGQEDGTTEVPPEIGSAALRMEGDPSREELVRMYLELIDGSSDLGLKRSMTHNEAVARLRELGLDAEVSQRLGRTFERSIYERGVPVKGDLEGFGRDKGVASGFVSRLMERLGPVLGRRGGKN